MWHRDINWANAVGKNGTDALAPYGIATNLQFVKKANICKEQ